MYYPAYCPVGWRLPGITLVCPPVLVPELLSAPPSLGALSLRQREARGTHTAHLRSGHYFQTMGWFSSQLKVNPPYSQGFILPVTSF